tara:strand:+ start:52063 stop:52332 length:270 start_codon:yes stop_codon:yes gene_type:complete
MSEEQWIANQDAYSSQVGDDLVLMSLETSSYYSLNSTGTVVWSLLQRPTTQTAVTEAVFEQFDVDKSRCEADISMIFEELKSAKLITAV